MSFYGEDVINNFLDISQTMTREQSMTPSIIPIPSSLMMALLGGRQSPTIDSGVEMAAI